jgi:hypothetical protein
MARSASVPVPDYFASVTAWAVKVPGSLFFSAGSR